MCTAKTCPTLAAPANASPASCSGKVQGDVCSFSCNAGFEKASGTETRTCNNEVWEGEALACQPQTCPILTAPENSVEFGQSCSTAKEEDICTFSCKPTFAVVGDVTRICRAGQWTGNVLTCVPERYAWLVADWSACSKTCGSDATRTRTADCVDTEAANAVVARSFCDGAGLHPVALTEACVANPPCSSIAWAPGAWSACSQACGGGIRTRELVCEATPEGGVPATVDASKCELLVKPPTSETCNPDACAAGTFTWATTISSACSVNCGGGTQSQSVECKDAAGQAVAETSCNAATKPSTVVACNANPCVSNGNYEWHVCPWDECSASCGGAGQLGMLGELHRQIFCRDKASGIQVDESLCTSLKSSTVVSGCNPNPCSENNWMTSPWTACTRQSDGRYKRTRIPAHCHSADGANLLTTACDAASRPLDTQDCVPNVCTVASKNTVDPGLSTAPDARAPSSSAAAALLLATAWLVV